MNDSTPKPQPAEPHRQDRCRISVWQSTGSTSRPAWSVSVSDNCTPEELDRTKDEALRIFQDIAAELGRKDDA